MNAAAATATARSHRSKLVRRRCVIQTKRAPERALSLCAPTRALSLSHLSELGQERCSRAAARGRQSSRESADTIITRRRCQIPCAACANQATRTTTSTSSERPPNERRRRRRLRREKPARGGRTSASYLAGGTCAARTTELVSCAGPIHCVPLFAPQSATPLEHNSSQSSSSYSFSRSPKACPNFQRCALQRPS